MEKEPEGLTIAGCWVHGRQWFDELLIAIAKEAHNKSVTHFVMKIQVIYREERKLKDLSS